MSTPTNDWTEDIDRVLDQIRMNSVILSKQHKKRYFYLNHILLYFRLPVIIISGINSIISVGLQPYLNQGTISMMTCLLALACSIVGSIELYLAIQKSMENELLASKDFYILSIDIHKTLTLSSIHRPIPAKEYLDKKYNEYVKLIENCELLSKTIVDSLNPLPELTLNSISSKYNMAKSMDEDSVVSMVPPLCPSSIFDDDHSMVFSTKTHSQTTTSVLNTLSNLIHSSKVGTAAMSVKEDTNRGLEMAKSIIHDEYKEKENQPLICSEKEARATSNIIVVKEEENELLSKSQQEIIENEKNGFV